MKSFLALIGSVVLFLTANAQGKIAKKTGRIEAEIKDVTRADSCRNCGGGEKCLRAPTKD